MSLENINQTSGTPEDTLGCFTPPGNRISAGIQTSTVSYQITVGVTVQINAGLSKATITLSFSTIQVSKPGEANVFLGEEVGELRCLQSFAFLLKIRSHNHRVAKVGRDLWRSSCPSACSSRLSAQITVSSRGLKGMLLAHHFLLGKKKDNEVAHFEKQTPEVHVWRTGVLFDCRYLCIFPAIGNYLIHSKSVNNGNNKCSSLAVFV